ncbi:MAG: LamG-like jellyroll fold domain-containing protein, partial [Bacteroidota bacterium]
RANGNRETILSRTNAASVVIALTNLQPQVSFGGLFPAQWVYSGTALPQNAWSHLAVSYAGGTITIYINGVAVQSQSGFMGVPTLSSGVHKLGARWDDTRAFAGRVDELRIFNTGLTAEMAQDEFARVSLDPIGCPVVLPTAAAIYSFNDCVADSAYDSQGGTDGVIVGATKAQGYDQTGLYFDGNDFVNLGTAPALQLTTGATFATWVNTAQTSGTGILLTDNFGGGNWSYTFYLRNGVPHLGLGTGVPNPPAFSMGQSVADGNWHHVAFTFGAGRVTAYLDGAAVNTWNNLGGAIIPNAATEVWIGGRAGKPRFFAGTLDELQIYDQALAPNQVAQLAAVAQNGTDCVAPRTQWNLSAAFAPLEVSVYPNPTHGRVQIVLGTSLAEEAHLTVTNLMGQEVYTAAIAQGQRELNFQLGAEVEAGVYLVSVVTESARITQRLVKQ